CGSESAVNHEAPDCRLYSVCVCGDTRLCAQEWSATRPVTFIHVWSVALFSAKTIHPATALPRQ
ncbi:MAG TPA: hypothetical protein VK797_03770, partial [Tepidisphaeraceae bacterium]|nr:hypothetical protein [Tepidisphaeraceae bacterium]